MSIASLSSGKLVGIMAGEEIEKPVLQILGSKRIKSAENSERYRLLVSDGQFLNSFAMLATQLNEFVSDGRLADYTIVRVDKYITSMVNKSEPGQTKRVLIILGLEVLNAGSEVGKKIGNPVSLSDNAAAAAAAAPKPVESKPFAPGTISSSNNNNSVVPSAPAASLNGHTTHPISSLSPYQNKWVIRARVMTKGPMRTWNNAKGSGNLFSVDLMDESGEIRATMFKETADKYFEMLQVDKVYYISRGQLKPANKQFNKLKNDYELTIGNESTVQECDDDPKTLPQIKYDFRPIADVAEMQPEDVLDVIGVCKEVGDVVRFTAKSSGRECVKRDLTLVDSSNASIAVTLWGNDAESFDGFGQPIVLVKSAVVREFGGGKTLSLGSGSQMTVNPDIAEGHRLRGWFDNGGADRIDKSISARTGASTMATDWHEFCEVAALDMGHNEKPDYYQNRVTIEKARAENAFYKACPTTDCQKKVVESEGADGQPAYRCEKCNAEYGRFKYRLLLNLTVSDWNANTYVTCFSDLAEQLLGHSAAEVGDALEHDKERAERMFAKVAFRTCTMKLRIKQEIFGDMMRPKTTAVAVSPLNYHERNRHLIKHLQEMTGVVRMES